MSNNIKRVFFSHPYSNAPSLNLSRITYILNRLNKIYPDIIFISPVHAFSYFNEEQERYRDVILDVCSEMIEYSSDEILLAGFSSGCMFELDIAYELDMPIKVFKSFDKLAKYKDIYAYIKEHNKNRGIYSYDFDILK